MAAKNRRWAAVLAVILLVTTGLSLYLSAIGEKEMVFVESERVLNNPGRGYYIQVDSTRYERIAELEEVRLILLAFDIAPFTDGPLPEEKTEELKNALKAVRESKKTVIFRAAYGFDQDVTEPDSLEIIALHIRQISEVLNEFTDVITVVQAGMYGDYGEWYDSFYLSDNKDVAKDNRLFLLQQWETYLDQQIKVAVRRPGFIREALEAEVLVNRLGLHNDALLSTDDDMGTYDVPGRDRMTELLWSSKALKKQVNGGEMPTPGIYNKPDNAHSEFQNLHVTYLNLKYNEEILNQWEKTEFAGSNAKDFIGNHLGYRLYISGIKYRDPVLNWISSMNGIPMEIELCNSGYASLGSQYNIYIFIKSENAVYSQKINIEELYSVSNEERVKFTFKIPKEMSEREGKIEVGIKIAMDSDETDSELCVELANEDVKLENGVNYFITFKKNGLHTESGVLID